MRLEDIGFYTLSDGRAIRTSGKSRMWRCEMLVTTRCNFACPYCRGVQGWPVDCKGDMPPNKAVDILEEWASDDLKNVRFSGGEPTLYHDLPTLVRYAQINGVERIAISTNGSQPPDVYRTLIDCGVNDFSISLDACCSTYGDKMAGVAGAWERVVTNIGELARLVYVTVGVVLTDETAHTAADVIRFAHDLGVADIRIVSAAQSDRLLSGLDRIPPEIIAAHPILRYRVGRYLAGQNVRGMAETDCRRCHLVKDDSVVAGRWHFPCVIYMREGGAHIGEVGAGMRRVRVEWSESHDTYADPICRKNCLDVCIAFNNRVRDWQSARGRVA